MMKDLIESQLDTIFQVDAVTLCVTYASPAISRFGINSPREANGRPLWSLVIPGDFRKITNAVRDTINNVQNRLKLPLTAPLSSSAKIDICIKSSVTVLYRRSVSTLGGASETAKLTPVINSVTGQVTHVNIVSRERPAPEHAPKRMQAQDTASLSAVFSSPIFDDSFSSSFKSHDAGSSFPSYNYKGESGMQQVNQIINMMDLLMKIRIFQLFHSLTLARQQSPRPSRHRHTLVKIPSCPRRPSRSLQPSLPPRSTTALHRLRRVCTCIRRTHEASQNGKSVQNLEKKKTIFARLFP